jgi:2,3-bisphosphoglycerate-dependent phosphoglycerate mutase
MASMRVLLIRHGQSRNNLHHERTGGTHNRWPDPGLTALGRRQADRLGAAFAAGKLPAPERILCSLMLRAVETAAPIAAATGVPVEGRLDLHEVGGVFEGDFLEAGRGHPGHGAADLVTACPGLILPAGADETGWYRFGPEAIPDGARRAARVVAGWQAELGDELVAVVAHGWFFQFILSALLGYETGDTALLHWFTFKNTAHALVESPWWGSERGCRVVWTDRADHLTAKMITE